MVLVDEYMRIAAANPIGAQTLRLVVMQADSLQWPQCDERWMVHATYDEETLVKPAAAWSAVTSMALCVAVLIASEFMPVSLLTPIAGDLGLTEGQAGQSISISGLFAVVTSLFIARLTRNIDRKIVLSFFSLLLIVSGTVVTFAPNYAALMVGRALLGVAIGGFWSMSTAIVMRLLPEHAVPRGLAMLNAGNAIAATISTPLGICPSQTHRFKLRRSAVGGESDLRLRRLVRVGVFPELWFVTKRSNECSQRRRRLPPTGVIEIVAGEGRAPLLKDAREPTSLDIGRHNILVCERETLASQDCVPDQVDIV